MYDSLLVGGLIILYVVSMVLVTISTCYLKIQLLFQRAYIDIEGDCTDLLLNKLYSIDDKNISVNLHVDISYKDKDGNVKDIKITRLSKTFIKFIGVRNCQDVQYNTLEYLECIIKSLNLKVLKKGFY